jgi:hypothetical protein
VRKLLGDGVIDLPPEVFEQRVIARPPQWLPIEAMAVGPAGTPVEQLSSALTAAETARHGRADWPAWLEPDEAGEVGEPSDS